MLGGQGLEGMGRGGGDARAAAPQGEGGALAGEVVNLMKQGLQGLFKGGGGGGDPFNFEKMQQEITSALAKNIYPGGGGQSQG